MNNDEIDILLDMLEILTDYQASAGCNDFWFPKHWTPEQQEQFENNIGEYQKTQGYDDEDVPYVDDSSVTYYLMSQLKKMKT